MQQGIRDDTEFHLVNDTETAAQMMRWISENRRDVMGLDTETSGLNPYAHDAKLRMVQIGDHRAGWAIPWERWGGVALEALNAWEGEWAVHNLAFDEKWLRIHAGWDVPWHRMHDTMIHYNMLYPGQPASLKFVTDKHIDPRASVGQKILDQAMKDQGWGWENIPTDFEPYAMYSAMDPVLAAYIWSFLRADAKFPKSFDLEMSTLRICSGMEDRGINIDVEYCEQQRDKLNEYVDNAKKWALDEYNVKLGSTQSLAKFFENDLGATISKRTPSGAPSVDKESLESLVNSENEGVSSFAKFVSEVRKADKIRGSYFENFLKDHTDGVLHPSIKTMRAVTGRMSITDPALQTLHSNDSIVRNAIVPRPNQVICTSDKDQVEFRIYAHLSEDKDLIETFRLADETGGDAFTLIGAQIYDDPNFSKTDPRRKLIKSTVYGKLYGSGVKKMADTAGVPFEVMAEVNKALDARYKGMASYPKKMEQILNNRMVVEKMPYIETVVTGRKVPVEEDRLYSGVNYTIQSSAAESFKENLVRLDAAGLSDHLMVPVHDEILVSVNPEDVHEVKQILKENMTTTEGWIVPLTADVEGPFDRWGDKYANH